MRRVIIFIILLLVFSYSFFVTSWTSSYMILEGDWKKHIVFTPEKVTEPQQIYEIDKFIYAFKYEPMISIVCVLSCLSLIGFVILWISKKFRHNTKSIEN